MEPSLEVEYWSNAKLQEEYQRTPQPVVCYGACASARSLISILQSFNILITCFCDKDEEKVGKLFHGIKIISLTELSQWIEPKYIILSLSEYWKESVVHTLQQYGVTDTVIILRELDYFYHKLEKKWFIREASSYFKSIPWYFYQAYDQIKDFSSEYISQVLDYMPNTVLKNGILESRDVSSRYVNVSNGERRTVPNLEQTITTGEKKVGQVYLYGNCLVFGATDDEHTVASFLQSKLLLEGHSMNVRNKGLRGSNEPKLLFDKISSVDYTDNDIVILCLSPWNHFFRGYTDDYEKATLVYFYYIQKTAEHCRKTNTNFLFCINPVLKQVKNPSLAESFIREQCCWDGLARDDLFYLSIPLLENLCLSHGIPYKNINTNIQRPHQYGEIFMDLVHLSPNGYRLIADVLFSYISFSLMDKTVDRNMLRQYETHVDKKTQIKQGLLSEKEAQRLTEYVAKLSEQKALLPEGTVVGAIVMNCNPFTKGHLFLIEQALKQVGFLYVFVVEEDQSFFPFAERFELVKRGTAHLKNIRVLPSGKYIISNITFPGYFQKEQQRTTSLDCSQDLQIFCEKIAPSLHIIKRFVGTEPSCSVTGEYNKQMKKYLPAHGIEVVEIERLCVEMNGTQVPISASTVRTLIENKDEDKLIALLPKTTLDHILGHD